MCVIKLVFTCVRFLLWPHFAVLPESKRHGGSDGPLAAIDNKPRQARKGATVVIDSGAEVWLFGSPPLTVWHQHELSSSCT